MGYYAVVDLEMCKIARAFRTKEYHWSQETIQIGAVLLNEEYEIVDKFCTYVEPQLGRINDFIAKMTGITQQNVEGAPCMQEALQRFVSWLPQEVELVSWSDSDRAQILHEITGKGLTIDREELLLSEWTDCQKMFDDKIHSLRAYNLTEALNLSDVFYEDGAHDGLVDAYNTALLFAKLRKTPDYKLNQYYHSLQNADAQETFGFSMGDLLAGIQLECAMG